MALNHYFLLSSFSAPSRSQSENVAGIKPP